MRRWTIKFKTLAYCHFPWFSHKPNRKTKNWKRIPTTTCNSAAIAAKRKRQKVKYNLRRHQQPLHHRYYSQSCSLHHHHRHPQWQTKTPNLSPASPYPPLQFGEKIPRKQSTGICRHREKCLVTNKYTEIDKTGLKTLEMERRMTLRFVLYEWLRMASCDKKEARKVTAKGTRQVFSRGRGVTWPFTFNF